MLLSEHIAKLIEQMIDEGKGTASVKRNDLAAKLGCVPSQVSYVISSRFTPQRGYITESRRGGGGYIRIIRVSMSKNQYLTHFFHALGDSVSEEEARAYIRNLVGSNILSKQEADIVTAAACASALDRVPAEVRNMVRSDILRHILMCLMQ